jgi:hypothetical protein
MPKKSRVGTEAEEEEFRLFRTRGEAQGFDQRKNHKGNRRGFRIQKNHRGGRVVFFLTRGVVVDNRRGKSL